MRIFSAGIGGRSNTYGDDSLFMTVKMLRWGTLMTQLSTAGKHTASSLRDDGKLVISDYFRLHR